MAIENRVTTSRLGRLSLMGQIAGGIVSGAVNEGFNQLLQGRRPVLKDMILTPQNGKRLTRRLSQMRGAAMKIGQLMSMDSGQVLPKEFTDMLVNLREDAHVMPLGQVVEVLNQELGNGWEQNFKQFIFTPIAAASIGQVHQATLKDGRQVAVKVQYPGITTSIDSDVDNVAGLLNLFRILPDHINILPLLEEAKQQLHWEADYLREADSLIQFARNIDSDPRYDIPSVVESLTSSKVLTMTHMEGQPFESLFHKSQSKNHIVARNMLELNLKEVFEWGLVQTDPNFSNYRYQADSGVIELLDFGATRYYDLNQRQRFLQLMKAAIDGNDDDVKNAATEVGYLDGSEPQSYESDMISLLRLVTEPFKVAGAYDFGASDLATRMHHIFIQMRLHNQYGTLPPADVLFLHRKLAGVYLLLSELRARVSLKELEPVKTLLY